MSLIKRTSQGSPFKNVTFLILLSIIFTITKVEAQGTWAITGPTTVGWNSVGTYSVPAQNPPINYSWDLTPTSAGTITSGAGTNIITIQWSNSYTGNAYLSCTASNQGAPPVLNASLTIQVMNSVPFAPGTLSPATQYINYGGSAQMITGTPATGGNGVYTYQWEQASPDAAAVQYYTDIPNANSLNFSPPANLKSTTYYRRIDACSTCGNLATNAVVVNVYQPLVAGKITPGGQSVFSGATLKALTCSSPTGGDGNYAYQWQSSADLMNWSDVSNATTTSLSLTTATTTTYYRVRISSYGQETYTDPSGVFIYACCDLPANTNYVNTSVFRQAGVTSTNLDAPHIAQMDINSVSQTVQYFDGLGRLVQTVQARASQLGMDVVTPIAYDQYGRCRLPQ